MAKVLQVFRLNLEEMKKDKAALAKLDGSAAEEALVQNLRGRNYDVFTDLRMVSGVSTTIVVAAKFSKQEVKADFYAIATKVGLPWFTLGEAYWQK